MSCVFIGSTSFTENETFFMGKRRTLIAQFTLHLIDVLLQNRSEEVENKNVNTYFIGKKSPTYQLFSFIFYITVIIFIQLTKVVVKILIKYLCLDKLFTSN